MAVSGIWNFALANISLVFEAFDRIGIRPPEVTRHHLNSSRVSLNLELLEWSNAGMNFWETVSGSVTLTAAVPTYTLPANIVTLTEVYFSTVNGGGAGINSDRILTPITRTDYAALPNKLQPGTTSQYWFQMLMVPQITLWPPPVVGGPSYVLNYYGLRQIMDANLGGGEIPDVPYRGVDALVSRLTQRLCEKFGPVDPQARTALMAEKKAIAGEAYELFARRDQEPGAMSYRPDVSSYARMRRR